MRVTYTISMSQPREILFSEMNRPLCSFLENLLYALYTTI